MASSAAALVAENEDGARSAATAIAAGVRSLCDARRDTAEATAETEAEDEEEVEAIEEAMDGTRSAIVD